MAAAENTSGDCINQQSGMDEFEYINNKFPHEVMIMFFSNLPRDDIITVQRVCHSWRAAAQDRCLWDHYTLTLTGEPEDKKKIIIMPALRNINGRAENHMVNVILENTMQLNKMNCNFDPPISTAQVQSMLGKYPELESIKLHLSAPDVFKSVEALKRSKYLKELLFNIHLKFHVPTGESIFVLLSRIFDLLADENNFPALRKLDFRQLYFADHNQFRAVIADIILKRSLKLQTLRLVATITDNADILNSVCMCTKLEELDLWLKADQLVNFNLDQMSELKSLFLTLYVKYNNCIRPVCESLNRGTWLHLEEIYFCVKTGSQFRGGVLPAIIQNAKQLKSLTYNDEKYETCEQELKHIDTLIKLQKIDITGLQAITKEGYTLLAGCQNLNYIRLDVHFSEEDTLYMDIAVLMHSMKKLECFTFTNDEDVDFMYLSNREKIENFISEFLST